MESGPILVLTVLLLLVLLACRVPVAFSLLAASAVGLFLLRDAGYTAATLGRFAQPATGRFVLIVIPFFLAMGVFVQYSGLGRSIFYLGHRFLGPLPGGLAIATVMACAWFAAISGSSAATVLSVGRVAIGEMRKLGYSKLVAAGVVGAAGTLGVLIPPSVVLVIYGVVTGESIGQLLVAGIIPGILSAVIYIVVIFVRARRRPEIFGLGDAEADGASGSGATSGEAGGVSVDAPTTKRSRMAAAQIALIFLVVVGGIYSGTFTVVEAASFAALIALGIMLLDIRRDGRPMLATVSRALRETMQLNGMAFALLLGAALFSTFLVAGGYGSQFTAAMVGLPVSPVLLVILLCLAFVPLGMFLDAFSMVLIAVPLVYPVITELGYDGVWLGIIVVKMIEIGLITPPLGVNGYVLAGVVDDLSVEDAFRAVLWFLPADLFTVVVLFAFPALVTWLPSFVR